jgi:hypothetical protein
MDRGPRLLLLIGGIGLAVGIIVEVLALPAESCTPADSCNLATTFSWWGAFMIFGAFVTLVVGVVMSIARRLRLKRSGRTVP